MGTELISFDSDMKMRASGIHVESLIALEKKVDLLMEAISMCHESNVEGACGPKCLACRVREIMESLQVAERIGGADE